MGIIVRFIIVNNATGVIEGVFEDDPDNIDTMDATGNIVVNGETVFTGVKFDNISWYPIEPIPLVFDRRKYLFDEATMEISINPNYQEGIDA